VSPIGPNRTLPAESSGAPRDSSHARHILSGPEIMDVAILSATMPLGRQALVAFVPHSIPRAALHSALGYYLADPAGRKTRPRGCNDPVWVSSSLPDRSQRGHFGPQDLDTSQSQMSRSNNEPSSPTSVELLGSEDEHQRPSAKPGSVENCPELWIISEDERADE
jgi:hypothetical protein